MSFPACLACALLLRSAAAWAQAEEVPPPPPAPPAAGAPAAPPAATPLPDPAAATVVDQDFALGLGIEGLRRLGDAAAAVGPRLGFGVKTGLDWTYARPAGLELGLGGGFSYQQFREVVVVMLPPERGGTRDEERSLTYYEFTARQTVAARLGRLRPYGRITAGFVMGYFKTGEPAFAPGERRATRPTAGAALGLDLATGAAGGRLGIEVAGTTVFRAPDLYTADGRRVPVLGPRVGVGLTFQQPF